MDLLDPTVEELQPNLQQKVALGGAGGVRAAAAPSTHSRTQRTGFTAPDGRCRGGERDGIKQDPTEQIWQQLKHTCAGRCGEHREHEKLLRNPV